MQRWNLSTTITTSPWHATPRAEWLVGYAAIKYIAIVAIVSAILTRSLPDPCADLGRPKGGVAAAARNGRGHWSSGG